MASTTRGSIKISTANEIGAALVDVLGGEGYKPDEWEQNINLCGIHAADIESALENIEEDAGTGTERGSILLSTANAIGATLNKKFNTSRGFSPREWASAASKLEPLPERTASGAIANITDGADGVPLKNWLVTLPASLDGYSEVNGVRSGKNLFDKDNADIVNGYIDVSSFNVNNDRAKTIYIPIKGGATYTVSKTVGARFSIATASVIPSSGAVYTSRQAGNTSASLTITASSNDKYLWAWVFLEGADTGTLADMLASIQIEVGSTATSYEPYEAPTTYTASLGRTIYGGTADIVTGEGQSTCKKVKLNSFNWSYNNTAYAYGFFDIGANISDMSDNKNFQATNYVNNGNPRNALADGEIGVYNAAGYVKRIVIRDDSCTTLEQFLTKIADYDFVYETTDTPTDFTFTPITPTPETALGVNNFWSDQGESAVTYRKDLDIPDPVPGNLLGMNNGNNNEEESEG